MAAVRVETASSAATEQVRRALSGRRADVWGFLFQLLLLFTLVFALAVLVVLLVDVARTAIPYLQDAAAASSSRATRRSRRTPG